MSKLVEYLENINMSKNKILDKKILNQYENFNYPDVIVFEIDLKMILETVYTDIKLCDGLEIKKKRMRQNEFRACLMELYSSKCVVSSNSNPTELQAAHIIEVKDGGDYDIFNGLILEANLHVTFDKKEWTINPDTLEIEIKPNLLHSSISKYKHKKIDLNMNPHYIQI